MRNAKQILIGVGLGISALVLLGVLLAPGIQRHEVKRRLMGLLTSPDAQQRKRGAWGASNWNCRAADAAMIRGLKGGEPLADVREAYVYSLGKRGRASDFDAVAGVLESDPSAYVRCAAWLAAVRLNPKRAAQELARRRASPDPWDQIGIAQARLVLGDVGGVDDLLHWAIAGDEGQRIVACRALLKTLRPLLDSVGSWPLEAHVKEGEVWPRKLVRTVRQRCAALPLQRVARETLRTVNDPASKRVRRNVHRVNGARDRIAAFLYGRQAKD